MLKSKSVAVEANYMSDTLEIQEIDLDMKQQQSISEQFKNSEDSLVDGCAGRMQVDTTYENMSESHISLVSSDNSDTPAAIDQAKHNYPHRRY